MITSLYTKDCLYKWLQVFIQKTAFINDYKSLYKRLPLRNDYKSLYERLPLRNDYKSL